jgi:hypothetical protein
MNTCSLQGILDTHHPFITWRILDTNHPFINHEKWVSRISVSSTAVVVDSHVLVHVVVDGF